ncbi:dihydrolipoyl dehydrogenase [Sulfoacidibacillus thermotolerans]|uniref:Dihydrolipoyl dehydrogenase n=1 Tax=Sulfoacidibacillus thermotolerans TaxID=1765684 RepID=A0A2U3DBL6_SULT2|nr:dihydrolipoyl dehydrogenase [Sulfoacidibacillus thermotolerans]PWI58679.1 dihydrolipoyl dehydrogenase [Sulfoacidibacillus thermotolerans]
METFDVVVLGGGTGGYVAAIRGAQLGLRVAVVEQGKLGGTCLHQGCIPSKALLRSAELFATVKEGDVFGIATSDLRFDLGKAMARKAQIVEQLHKGIQYLMKKNHITVIEGYGRIMGPSIFSPMAGAVRVERPDGDSEILSPKATIIATGSRPRVLPGLPFDGVRVLSSDEALQLTTLPASAIIVGGGAIGVEWASMLADFGVQVTIVEALPRILVQEDEEISAEMTRLLKKRKVAILTGAAIDPSSYRVEGNGIAIRVNKEGSEQVLTAEMMLVAIGREPRIDDIGLEATQIKIERGAIVVDATMRTAEKNIYAIGDVIGGMQLAHVAAHEGILAMEAIAGEHPDPLNYANIARCTYGRPEVASVGLTEAQAREQGYTVKTAKFPFKAIGKALVYGEADGFVKIIGDQETNDLLGVHMVGPHVTDLISEAALAHVLDAAPFEIGQTIHPHPTLTEALGEAALALDGRAIHS